MKLSSDKPVYVIAVSEYVIQKGERKGEVVPRVSLSDGTDIYQEVNISDKIDLGSIKKFTQPYLCMFDYSVRTFGDKVYKSFMVDTLEPVK